MKRKLLTKSLLLLLGLLLGAGSVSAQETATITFGTNNVKINAASVTGNDSQGKTWTITTVGTTSFTSNASYYQVGSSKNPATSITFTTTLTSDVNVTAFSANFGGFSGTAGTVTLKVGDTTVGTGSLNDDNDVTVSSTSAAEGKVLTVTVTGISKGVKCYNISYTYNKSTDPQVGVDETEYNVSAEDEDGTIEVTYSNITDVVADVAFYKADGKTPATYDWIDAEIDQDNNLYYVVSANNGSDARTAYLKVYALVYETNVVYSELITITQAAPVVTTTYTLANAIVSGKHYIITNESDAAMGYDRGNNRDAVEIEINDGTTSVLSDAGVYEFVIYGPDADGRYSIYDEVTPGYLYAASSSSNYLKTKATLDDNGKWSIVIDATTGEATIKAMGTNTRNLMGYNYNNGNDMFSCYQESKPQAPVYLYEKNGETTPTESRTLNEFGYATYCSQNALDFTDAEGVTAWAITDVNGENITFSQITGKVPAGTGMLLKGAANESVTMTSATGAVTALADNLLVGTLAPLTITDNQYYGLNGNTFVPVNAGTVPAGKALLPVSAVPAGSRLTFVFEDATGIATIEHSPMTNDRYYNLSGQRVDSPRKGLYIVNGKKVVVK